MRSTRSRFSEAAHAANTLALVRRLASLGGSGAAASPSASVRARFPTVSEAGEYPMTLVATTTRSRSSGLAASQLPTMASLAPGRHRGSADGAGYISAVSTRFPPRVLT